MTGSSIVTVVTVRRQRAVDARGCWRMPTDAGGGRWMPTDANGCLFVPLASLLFSSGPQPRGLCCPRAVCTFLPVKPPWKCPHRHAQKSVSDEPPQWPSHSRALAPLVPITQVFSAWSVSPRLLACSIPSVPSGMSVFLCSCCLCKAGRMSLLNKPFPFLPGDEFGD